jgi:hypothetical protein
MAMVLQTTAASMAIAATVTFALAFLLSGPQSPHPVHVRMAQAS